MYRECLASIANAYGVWKGDSWHAMNFYGQVMRHEIIRPKIKTWE